MHIYQRLGRLLNLSEAAEFCGFKSRQGFYYHIHNQAGPPCIEIAGKPHYDPAELATWNKNLKRGNRRGKKA